MPISCNIRDCEASGINSIKLYIGKILQSFCVFVFCLIVWHSSFASNPQVVCVKLKNNTLSHRGRCRAASVFVNVIYRNGEF